MNTIKVISKKSVGVRPTIDLEVSHKDHNFYAEGLVTSNSHSQSYSILAAQSVYLKFKYPLDFFLESLKLSKNKQDISNEISLIQSELKYFGINLLQPDLVKSDLGFKKDGQNLRFGLSAIKGISDKSIEKLKEFLESDKANKFEVFQAAKNAKLNIGILSSLIQAGTLNSIDTNRPKLVYESQLFNLLTDKEKMWCFENGAKYGYSLFNILNCANEIVDYQGRRVFKDTRLATLKKKAEPYRKIFVINSKSPDFAAYVYEKKLLGFSYSQKLAKLMSNFSTHAIKSLINAKYEEENARFSICGDVKVIEEKMSKKQKPYVKLTLSDESDSSDVLIFEPNLSKIKDSSALPKEGDIIIANVTKWNDTLTVSEISICSDKVYMKLSELKEDENSKEDSVV